MKRHLDCPMTDIATACVRRGIAITSLQVRTPDGRDWSIDAVRAGGFRLFEIDLDFRRGPEEHDAVEGDAWTEGDLLDYLEAVGRPKAPPSTSETSKPLN